MKKQVIHFTLNSENNAKLCGVRRRPGMLSSTNVEHVTCKTCNAKLLPRTKTVDGFTVYLTFRSNGAPVYVSIPE